LPIIELRLLDYLLRHFRDSPEAQRPAVFPLTSPAYFNQRAAAIHARARLVQQRLWHGDWVHVANARQAHERVASVLRRMASPSPAESTPGEYEMRRLPTSRWRDGVYSRLASDKPDVRLSAINVLGRFGNLDDIGLLADLAALPPQDDEHPHERAALLHAMQRIAGLTTAVFFASNYTEDTSAAKRTWDCIKCGTSVPVTFDVCWACGTPPDGIRTMRT
jgi:hypothetical protein